VGQQLNIPVGKDAAVKNTGTQATKPASVTSTTKHTPAPVTPTPAVEKPADAAPQFEIKPPPPGQDLDPGLKENTSTDVPTIKVEESKPGEAAK